MGELKAEVKITAPIKNMNGDALSGNLSKVIVMRDGLQIKEFTDVAPGEDLTLTDSHGLTNGYHAYFAVPFGVSGEDGHRSESVRVYIGTDIPKPVEALNVFDMGADKMMFTWKRVTKGKEGGYINPAEVTYRLRNAEVKVSAGMKFLIPTDTIIELTDKQKYEYPFSLDEGSQGFKYYGLETENIAGLNGGIICVNELLRWRWSRCQFVYGTRRRARRGLPFYGQVEPQHRQKPVPLF